MSDPRSIRIPRGAVPLDRRPAPAGAPAAPAAGAATPPAPSDSAALPTVLDVGESTFQRDVLEESYRRPVVLDFWAAWCQPCRQLSPVLERLAAESAGAFLLAKIDCDANGGLAQAAGVQGIPAVKAVVQGQLVSEFTGALPEAEVRRWLAEVLTVAAEQGMGVDGQAVPPPPPDPALVQADEALRRGDLEGAATALTDLLNREPANAVAQQGLARVRLVQRSRVADVSAMQARVTADPTDVEAQCALADDELVRGEDDAAFARLVDTVRRTGGDARDRARAHLIDLFAVLGPDDPRVAAARRALASALF